MPRPILYVIWISTALLIVGGAHYYLWLRWVRDPGLAGPWRIGATVTLIALAIALPVGAVLERALSAPWLRPLTWLSFVWMGLGFFALASLAGGELVRLAELLWVRWTGAPDPARRALLVRGIAGAAATATVLLGGVALAQGQAVPELRRVRVKLRKLPSALNGFTIAQICDLHLGPTLGRPFLEDIVQRINAAKPDVVAIVGDFADATAATMRDVVEPLRSLQPRYGTFFVTGNHEYYTDLQGWLDLLPRVGVRVLRNERVAVGPDATPIDIAGVDDPTGRQLGGGHGDDVGRALAGRDPEREVVLLAHQPKTIHAAAKHDVGLQLSGHTHGGQIWPFGYLVALTQPYMSGLHRHGPRTQIYVSRGTGYWGPPMRLGAPAEISLLELMTEHG